VKEGGGHGHEMKAVRVRVRVVVGLHSKFPTSTRHNRTSGTRLLGP